MLINNFKYFVTFNMKKLTLLLLFFLVPFGRSKKAAKEFQIKTRRL